MLIQTEHADEIQRPIDFTNIFLGCVGLDGVLIVDEHNHVVQ